MSAAKPRAVARASNCYIDFAQTEQRPLDEVGRVKVVAVDGVEYIKVSDDGVASMI